MHSCSAVSFVSHLSVWAFSFDIFSSAKSQNSDFEKAQTLPSFYFQVCTLYCKINAYFAQSQFALLLTVHSPISLLQWGGEMGVGGDLHHQHPSSPSVMDLEEDLPNLTVRTITIFLPADILRTSDLQTTILQACSQVNRLKSALLDANVSVQTTRISIPSPAVFSSPQHALQAAKLLDQSEIQFVSMGTVTHDQTPFCNQHFFEQLFSTTSNTFATLTIAHSNNIYPHLCNLAAQIITSSIPYEDGLRNFRFAALANVHPNCPFFPSSYASSTTESASLLPISLGVQASNLLIPKSTLSESCNLLVDTLQQAANRLVQICAPVAKVTIDMSLAPQPTPGPSTANRIAAMAGIKQFGQPGTLAACAAVTSAMQKASFPKAGLNGIMLPPVEDVGLKHVSLDQLLQYSSVCGLGLDAVPLPADTNDSTISAILMDVAAMSCRLGKQLSARLIPVPGAKAGDLTPWSSQFMCQTPVLHVPIVDRDHMSMDNDHRLTIDRL